MIASMMLFLGLLSMVSGQVMEGLVQLDKSSIDKVRSLQILGHHLKPFVQAKLLRSNWEQNPLKPCVQVVNKVGGSKQTVTNLATHLQE